MVRRLLAIGLAFGVVGVPLAEGLCDARCAAHVEGSIDTTVVAAHHHHGVDPASRTSEHHHSHVTPARSHPGVSLTSVRHVCRYVQPIAVESRELTHAAPAIDSAFDAVGFTSWLERALASSETDDRHGPPGHIRSISPLRI
jgi:hypothetical protein